MADVRISPLDWRHLKKRALFFVPPLIRYQALYNISNVEISNASRALGAPLSAQVVGAINRLVPVTYDKAVSAVNALNVLAERKQLKVRISHEEIIAFVFALIKHKDTALMADLSEEELERLMVERGISKKVVQNALRGGRINLHVAQTIYDVLHTHGYVGKITDLVTSDSKIGFSSIWRDEKGEAPMLEFEDLKKSNVDEHPWGL